MGIIPRSLIRTLHRFIRQILYPSTDTVLDEYRISRYQVLISVKVVVCVTFIPLFSSIALRHFVFAPVTDYLWNRQQPEIFLTSYLEKQAIKQLQSYESELYFDYMITPNRYEKPFWASYQTHTDPEMQFQDILKSRTQDKTVQLAKYYNEKSIEALTNMITDIIYFGTMAFVICLLKYEVIIFKSFVIELFYSLSDTNKSVFLLFSTNLLVGYHSARGWECLLESTFDRYGLPPNDRFVLVFIALFPVLLDTVFKYWIFRYLNKISPSTVSTYHAMIE